LNAKASLTEALSDKVICHTWQRMLSIYGHKWASHLGQADDGTGTLTDAAKTWQKGLSGVTIDQLKHGFDALIFKNHDWPPSLPEFRKLCLSNVPSDIPSVDEVMKILASVSARSGSIAARYVHPFIFAVSMQIDMYALRSAKTIDAVRMIKPVYDKLIDTGWSDWPEFAHEEQKAIARSRNVPAALAALKLIRVGLSRTG
jgi:hypothetical protein